MNSPILFFNLGCSLIEYLKLYSTFSFYCNYDTFVVLNSVVLAL